jgi:hypothetical protein
MDSRTKGKTVMEVGGDGVAVITLINPPVNSLSFDGTYSQIHFIFMIRNLLDFTSSDLGQFRFVIWFCKYRRL